MVRTADDTPMSHPRRPLGSRFSALSSVSSSATSWIAMTMRAKPPSSFRRGTCSKTPATRVSTMRSPIAAMVPSSRPCRF